MEELRVPMGNRNNSKTFENDTVDKCTKFLNRYRFYVNEENVYLKSTGYQNCIKILQKYG